MSTPEDEGRALLRRGVEELLSRLRDGTYSPADLELAEEIVVHFRGDERQVIELVRANLELRRVADRRYLVQVVCAVNPGPTLIDIYDAVTGELLLNAPVDVCVGLVPDPMSSANPSLAEALAWLRAVATSRTSLSARPARVLVEHLGALDRRGEGPEDGHTFEVAVRLRGSYSVVGREGHRDEPEWGQSMVSQQVRAWSLAEALEKAQRLPLDSWFAFPDEEDPA